MIKFGLLKKENSQLFASIETISIFNTDIIKKELAEQEDETVKKVLMKILDSNNNINTQH